jgi:hypothetical protein
VYSTLMESDGVDPSGRGEGTTRTGRTREVRARSGILYVLSCHYLPVRCWVTRLHTELQGSTVNTTDLVVNYESIKRDLQRRPIFEGMGLGLGKPNQIFVFGSV